MGVNDEINKQSIHVYYSSIQKNPSAFCFLLYGIEEEGVPVYLEEKNEHAAIKLSYEAALDSSLGVGIGVGGDHQIILHYSKLLKENALFKICQKEIDKQRILGVNAARLVKGIPFKSFKNNSKDSNINEETATKEEIVAIVTIVLKKLYEIRENDEICSEGIKYH